MTDLLQRLSTTMAELKALAPQSSWCGDVRRAGWVLPYETVDPNTGERATVHAVMVGSVLFVSDHAWNALKQVGDAR